MANAVEDALNRASAKDKEVIAAGKSSILSVENTTEVTPPSTPTNVQANTEQPKLDPQTQSNIESAQQGQGNNYLDQNAINRAQSRPSQEPAKPTPELDKER